MCRYFYFYGGRNASRRVWPARRRIMRRIAAPHCGISSLGALTGGSSHLKRHRCSLGALRWYRARKAQFPAPFIRRPFFGCSRRRGSPRWRGGWDPGRIWVAGCMWWQFKAIMPRGRGPFGWRSIVVRQWVPLGFTWSCAAVFAQSLCGGRRFMVCVLASCGLHAARACRWIAVLGGGLFDLYVM